MAFSDKLTWETLRSLAAPFTGAYQALGNPLSNPSYICKIVNNSDVALTISIDGSTDIDIVPAYSFFLYDEGKVGQSSAFPALPKGTQFYVKGTAGTGTVYLVSQYLIV